MPQNRKDSDAQAITSRLKGVAAEKTLIALARKTGTPQANVHRYLHGARVPADFCAKLVREFSVNPAWLLNGEGSPDLAGIAQGTAKMGAGLLELIESMNAVMHMRLGALAGKHHLKVLRELNDALARYDGLRVKLSAHALPIFRQLRDQLAKALNSLDIDRAEELMKAAEQVERLCHDENASHELLHLRAHFSLLKHDPASALAAQQRIFRAPLSFGKLGDNDSCAEAVRLLFLLNEAGREVEALRVAKAALALAGEEGQQLAAYPMLASLCGQMQINQGALREGAALLQRWMPRVTVPAQKRAARHMLMMSLIYGGALEPEHAFEYGEHHEVKALDLISLALALEDAALLKRALDYFSDRRIEHMKVYEPLGYLVQGARALLNIKEGKRSEGLELLEAVHSEAEAACEAIILRALVLRHAGQLKQAREAHSEAAGMLSKPGQARVSLLMKAVLNRNAIALKINQKRADEFFERHVAAGYEIFRLPAKSAGIQ